VARWIASIQGPPRGLYDVLEGLFATPARGPSSLAGLGDAGRAEGRLGRVGRARSAARGSRSTLLQNLAAMPKSLGGLRVRALPVLRCPRRQATGEGPRAAAGASPRRPPCRVPGAVATPADPPAASRLEAAVDTSERAGKPARKKSVKSVTAGRVVDDSRRRGVDVASFARRSDRRPDQFATGALSSGHAGRTDPVGAGRVVGRSAGRSPSYAEIWSTWVSEMAMSSRPSSRRQRV
jgi:hypothetical protein